MALRCDSCRSREASAFIAGYFVCDECAPTPIAPPPGTHGEASVVWHDATDVAETLAELESS